MTTTLFTEDGSTNFAAFDDLPGDPAIILDRIIELDPDISPTLARAFLHTITVYICRGEWISGARDKLSDISRLVDAIIPEPLPVGQIQLL